VDISDDDMAVALNTGLWATFCFMQEWYPHLRSTRASIVKDRYENRDGEVWPAIDWRTTCNKKGKATPMTIIVDIRPEVQAELTRQAAAHGVDIGRYAASLLEEAAHFPAGSKTLSQSQLDATLQELAQFSHKIPLLPDEAFSRESLDRVHD
jgi:hypothetical protein